MNAFTTVEENTSQPTLKKYTLPRLQSWLHIAQVVFTVLSVSLIAPVIAIQLKFKGASAAGTNYVLFVAIFTFVIPICLVVFPWMYESKNKMKRCGKFFLKPRTNVIFTGFYSLLWLTAGIAVTTYAINPDSCNLDSNIKDAGYDSAWPAQCNCARVATVLVWITCLLWMTTLVMALVVFWKQKQLVQKNLQNIGKTKLETAELNTELMGDDGTNEKIDVTDMDNNHHGMYAQQQHIHHHQQQPSFNHHHAAAPVPPMSNYTNNPGIVAEVTEPSFYSNQPYPSTSTQYQQPSSITPHPPQQQQEYYSDVAVSQQHQPLLPLAVMPEPQHYKQQHGIV
ncbi:unnamed protein product [Absidia cylindrospora]